MQRATVIKCGDVDDLEAVEVATVECYRCDPDNPLAVPRETCPVCRGTGRAPADFVPIMREIRGSMSRPKKTPCDGQSDLLLEY
jgi:hypothetical protein